MIQKIKQFLTTDIWRIRKHTLPRSRLVLVNNLRIIILALRGFAEDKCQLRASALTFYSLLSIVPVMAMAFGIAKGFGFEKMLEEQLTEKLQGQEEVMSKVVEFARTMLENTSGGIVAGIGVALLFWTVIKVLGNIELSFNHIWGIKKPRTLMRKFSDYLAIMLICPLLLLVASSVTVFVTSQIQLVTEKISLLGILSPLIYVIVRLIPYSILWLLFSFIYVVMPNTKVNISSGIFGGIIGGTIYQIIQWVYITFQIGVSKLGAIYGSFAALPLFLVWLQMSWLVVLLGAEISFAHQNVDTYEFEPDCLNASYSFKRLISLHIVRITVKKFLAGEHAITAAQIAQELDLPIRLVNQIVYDLVRSGILAEVRNADERVNAYQPARDPAQLSISYVLKTLEQAGADTLPLPESPELKRLQSSLQSLRQAVEKSSANVLLKDV